MLNVTKHIILFECCQLTRGYTRSILIDFQRKDFELIPNELESILSTQTRQFTIEEIFEKNIEIKDDIVTFFSFLLENEYAFLCNPEDIKLFPTTNLEWEYPSLITNAIIDIGSKPLDFKLYLKVISELSDLGCEAIEIRNYNGIELSFLDNLIKKSSIHGVYKFYLTVKHNDSILTANKYKQFLLSNHYINQLLVHSYNGDITESLNLNTGQTLYITNSKIHNRMDCGVVNFQNFNFEFGHFLESQNNNTCLNRKISINEKGEIRNCPSLQTTYGNIVDNDLKTVLEKTDFTKVWNISKNKITDCNICEFRHICTDCRAYHKSDLSLNKPFKCNYNPYTGRNVI